MSAMIDIVIYHKCYNEILEKPEDSKYFLFEFASGPQGFEIPLYTNNSC